MMWLHLIVEEQAKTGRQHVKCLMKFHTRLFQMLLLLARSQMGDKQKISIGLVLRSGLC